MVDNRVWFVVGLAAAEYGVGADEVLRKGYGGPNQYRARRRFAQLALEKWPAAVVARWWGRSERSVRVLARRAR